MRPSVANRAPVPLCTSQQRRIRRENRLLLLWASKGSSRLLALFKDGTIRAQLFGRTSAWLQAGLELLEEFDALLDQKGGGVEHGQPRSSSRRRWGACRCGSLRNNRECTDATLRGGEIDFWADIGPQERPRKPQIARSQQSRWVWELEHPLACATSNHLHTRACRALWIKALLCTGGQAGHHELGWLMISNVVIVARSAAVAAVLFALRSNPCTLSVCRVLGGGWNRVSVEGARLAQIAWQHGRKPSARDGSHEHDGCTRIECPCSRLKLEQRSAASLGGLAAAAAAAAFGRNRAQQHWRCVQRRGRRSKPRDANTRCADHRCGSLGARQPQHAQRKRVQRDQTEREDRLQ
ncbi:hypothetical protein CAOG_009393 [Capsaspora owczarzaki ATCC 30864]|uniref:Uncharacterized protein n=1 Tax=Capsaspora owczarzaki (strain ATCC 30864) TaxID=595528 RepID=A0A0D2WIS7_CAPO3|nr:hypothetical protein CAOG_009393 [Capsaspora owczarzaki ATCC 30864]